MSSSKPLYVIIANFGNESVALIQWAIEQKLDNLLVVSVDTNWQSEAWQARVSQAHDWLSKNSIAFKRIKAVHSMQDCVRERGTFPNKKLQWCAGFLKGLALNDYLDEVDPSCEATLLFAKRRDSSRANQWLEEYVVSEHFNGRSVWHPILAMSDSESELYIHRAGLEQLSHQSLECMPCIHASPQMLQAMTKNDIARVADLEQEIGHTMFDKPIADIVKNSDKGSESTSYLEQLDMGCGSEFGCGE